MDAINEALKALKQVAFKGKMDKGLAERLGSLRTALRLLDTSLMTDSRIFEKLIEAVREPLIPFYEKVPFHAFQLSAEIFSFLFHEKIVMQLTAGNKALQSNWEDVAESLLSGILDFLEQRSDSATLRTLASALYPVLCRICFSTTFCSSITIGSTLRYTAFTLLVDSADEPTNKEMLEKPEYLGSRRLGATLYGSKDYVVLENLLLLVLIVAPKFDSMDKRNTFMREVFVTNYPEDAMCGENLARILAKPTERDSDLLQAQAIDVLAKSNLMFPQLFDVSQIDSCGLGFPQKPPLQRLIVDYKSLLANVIKEEGYESFRVPFDQICDITFSEVDKALLIKVVVRTSSAPTIQSQPLKVPDGQHPSVTFEIRKSDVLRFKRALRCRGIAVPPHISVSQDGPRLEFGWEGNAVPETLASTSKVRTIEEGMQLSQRSDDSPRDQDDQDREDHPLVKELLVSPSVHSVRTAGGVSGEGSTPSKHISAPPRALPDLQVSHKTHTATKTATTRQNTKHADITPRPREPRQQSVFVPATPSQRKILRKDAFGSGDTDLSELSDGSEVDSMKALSQKLAARTDSLIAITKRASILDDSVSSVQASGRITAKRRVLDSDDEAVLPSSKKGATVGSKRGAGNTRKAVPTAMVSDGDDIPPPPDPIGKGRPKPTKKNPGPLVENPKPLPRDNGARKRKRKDNENEAEVGDIFDIQDDPPPVKRARKTAGGKAVASEPTADSTLPPPPRDSQVLKKARTAAKKNANYGGRTKAAPAHDSAPLSDDDAFSETLGLEAGLVDTRIEPLVDNNNDDELVSPPAPKPKSKAAVKPKPILGEKTAPLESSKATAGKSKAKTQAGTRTRVANKKGKAGGDKKISKVGPPRKAKAKRNPEVESADEGKDKEGEGETAEDKLTKDTQGVIEVTSSHSESPKPEHKPVPRVILQEQERVKDAQKTENRTRARPTPKKVLLSRGEGNSRGEEVNVEPVEVIAVPAPLPKRSAPTEKRTKIPISERAVATSVEWRLVDHASGATKAERLPRGELCSTSDSRLDEADSLVVDYGGVDNEVEAEVIATGIQGSRNMDLEPDRLDPIVTESQTKIQAGGITKISPVRVREPVEAEELRPPEMNRSDGESPEGGTHNFTMTQLLMDPMPVDIPTPKGRSGINAGFASTAQSTPATLPRGPQHLGQMSLRKPRVTFATTPLKGKGVARPAQSGITPRSGAQRRTIFEGDVFGTNSAWKRLPSWSSDKHSTLVGVLGEIQDVIVKKITHQFEVAEEEARFARNDVHNEALLDFKKMHSQRAVQFNALVDLETTYATREGELVAGYEAALAVNAEILDHVRLKIREHDETTFAGKLPKTLRKSPMSALMSSYLK